MNLTSEDGMQESMFPMFGWTTDDEGYVTDGETRVKDTRGEIIRPEEIGGFVERYGDTVPLRDRLVDYVDQAKYERNKDEDHICKWE